MSCFLGFLALCDPFPLLCFFHRIRSLIRLSLAAFNMTKRDPQFAELVPPRVLRMESRDIDIPMGPITNYTSPPPSLPLPSSSTASSTTGNTLLQLPATLRPGEYRQRNAHATIFKIFEHGKDPAELRVEEIDSNGYIKKNSLENYFLGIIGHLGDSHGQSMDTWELCQQLSNYWREWFGLPAHGAVFPAYPPINQNPFNEGASSWTSTRGPTTTQQTSPTRMVRT